MSGERRAVVAVAGEPLAARELPGGPILARFDIANENDFPTLFWVRARKLDASCRASFSPTLRKWPQDGPIAIHGTNDPGSIGAAVSHDCICISDAAARVLHRLVLAGTTVVIHR